MKNRTQELINDVLTGLAFAAAFAAVIPGEAQAQLLSATTGVSSNVVAPFLTFVSYGCYGVGTVLTVAGIAHCKKHADNPGQNPLGPALGKLGAGAALLTAPTIVGMMQSTGSAALNSGTGSFTGITF